MNKKFTLFSCLSILWIGLHAQFNYKIATASVISGTYTDLGTSGSSITTANFDDANSAATPIGFTFNYSGQAFTNFVLNTNGFIKLGSTAPGTANIFGINSTSIAGGVLLTDPATQYCISPFNHDLTGGVTPEYRVSTAGSVGSRICTIQWKDVVDKTTTPVVQMASMNFQVRLYETSNIVEFVYGTFTASGNATNFKTAGAGLIGADTTAANTIFMRKGSTQAWTAAIFASRGTVSSAAFQSLSFRNTVLPVAGITYRFTPQFTNDLSVIRVEGLGKSALPFTNPETISAKITNVGSTASSPFTSVGLVITGANPTTNVVTIPSLAPGASTTITVGVRNPTNIGTDTIRVGITPDDNNTNNISTLVQSVNNTTVSYSTIDPIAGGLGYNTGSGLIACKYKINTTRFVKAVNITISNDAATVGQTIYALALDSNGLILHRSPNYVVLAGDLGTTKTFTLDTAAKVTAGPFFVAMAQTVGSIGYFPSAYQTESNPARSGAYYTGALTGGTMTPNFTIGRFMVEAVLDGADAQLVSVSSNATCPANNRSIDVVIKNNDVLPLNLAVDSIFVVATTTGPIAQGFVKKLNSGTIAPGASQTFNITNLGNFSNAGTYALKAQLALAKDLIASNDSISVSTVVTPFVVNLGADISTCNASTLLDAGNLGSTYLWNNASTNQTLNVTANGQYSVLVTTPAGCSDNDTINVVLNSGVATSTISPKTATICVGDSSIFIGGPSGGVYSVNAPSGKFIATAFGVFDVVYSVTSICGTATDTAKVTVNALPVVTATATPPAVCVGSISTLTGGGALTYVWNNGVIDGLPIIPATTGSYTVIGTGANGCSNSATVSITVNSLPTVSGTATPPSVCVGASTILSGAGALTYAWNFGVTNGVAFVPTASLNYTVTGTDANGCINTATVPVLVNQLPVVSFTTSVPQPYCAGSNVTLTGTPAGGSYSITAGNPAAISGNIFNAPSVGPYTVEYSFTDANTCTGTASQIFVINCVTGIEAIAIDQNVRINAMPNPNNGTFELNIQNTQSDKAIVKVLSMDGSVLSTKAYDLQGNTSIKMNANNYAAGIYYVNVSNSVFNKTIKIVKQ
jgi:hypothetical protein